MRESAASAKGKRTVEGKEIVQLFRMLGGIYPKCADFKDDPNGKNCAYAWLAVLEPYSYSEVREASIQWARGHSYPPHVTDIKNAISPVGDEKGADKAASQHRDLSWMSEYIDKLDEEIERKGGTCQVLHNHGGVVGETLLRYTPEGCAGCRRAAVSGCPHEQMIKELR